MVTKSQKVRLAVFFIIGFTVLAIVFILLLGSRITEKKDFYRIIYTDSSVAGLQIGGAVLYRGIQIGRVEDIQIDRDNINNIIVHIYVKAGTPIKADNEATMIFVGITGLKQIQLVGGTNSAAFLKPGDVIPTGKTMFSNLADKAGVLTDKIEIVIDNIIAMTAFENQEKISNIIKNIDLIMQDSQQPIVSTMAHIEDISAQLTTTTSILNDILENVSQLFEDGKVNNIVKNTETLTNQLVDAEVVNQINTLMTALNETVNRSNIMLNRVDALVQKNSPEINDIIHELRETVENLNEFTRLLADDPSLLIRSSTRK